jgi:hypothetical protein
MNENMNDGQHTHMALILSRGGRGVVGGGGVGW